MTADVVVVVEQLRLRVPGGIGTYAAALVGALARLEPGTAPRLALYASAARGSAADPLGCLGIELLTSPLPSPLLVRAWDHGLGALRACRVVHACSLAAPPPGPPLVVTVHDLAWRCEATGGRREAWHEAALRRAARRARHFVVPSQATAEALLGAGHGVSHEQVSVIEEGADHLPEPDDAAAGRLLRGLGVLGPFLLAVGTLEPRKNLARLLEAYRRLRPELPEPWPLLLVGPAGWGPALRPVDGVVVAGRVADAVLAALYRRARCCAYVPLLEGFGLPVVEAMAAGSPVVSSPVPSAGGASLLVDPGDVASIADGLLAAATDEQRRAELVARGSARAGALTWRAAALAHVALWCRLGGFAL